MPDASHKLNEIYDKLTAVQHRSRQPGNDKTDNVKTAKEQEQQLRDWIGRRRDDFQPVPPIPQGEVTSKTYATALGTTIYQLQQEAKENSVDLPPKYNFSFPSAKQPSSPFPPAWARWPSSWAKSRPLRKILFAARVNDLAASSACGFPTMMPTGCSRITLTNFAVTNDLAIITPYVVTFQLFHAGTGARCSADLPISTNPFIVKSVSVQPANAPTPPRRRRPAPAMHCHERTRDALPL